MISGHRKGGFYALEGAKYHEEKKFAHGGTFKVNNFKKLFSSAFFFFIP